MCSQMIYSLQHGLHHQTSNSFPNAHSLKVCCLHVNLTLSLTWFFFLCRQPPFNLVSMTMTFKISCSFCTHLETSQKYASHWSDDEEEPQIKPQQKSTKKRTQDGTRNNPAADQKSPPGALAASPK